MDTDVVISRLPSDSQMPLLTVQETALTLRLSTDAVWRKIKAGQLEAVQLGGPGSSVRVPASSVRALMHPYHQERPDA